MVFVEYGAFAAMIRREYLQAFVGAGTLVLFSLVFGQSADLGGVGKKGEVRLAYFPNLTHAPALIGVDQGVFRKDLGEYSLSTKVVNAGPEAMEALLAGSIDMAYVGPSPALNTYIRSHGKALKIVAGVCSGGALLVANPRSGVQSVADLGEKRVAVPEIGGTQDVSLRHFLKASGLGPRTSGGTVDVLPLKNPDILTMFKQGQLDAAWVPEPWATRLVVEAGAKTVVDERTLWPNGRFTTTVLVSSQKFINEHSDAVQSMIRANSEVIAEMAKEPGKTRDEANEAIKKLTGKGLKAKVLDAAWSHLSFSDRADRDNLLAFAAAAHDAGYIKVSPEAVDNICVGNFSRIAANK